jgi:hypothetical protein
MAENAIHSRSIVAVEPADAARRELMSGRRCFRWANQMKCRGRSRANWTQSMPSRGTDACGVSKDRNNCVTDARQLD